ncbi:MAG: sulfur globule protein CV1 [Gammaproteobacteria bacterium]|nr:sulfur globule protein CV1 [Gammaproteobacteria bacterium]MCP5440712.1 sulfur globule protein CV1 [Chromatiaceae bacterium]
MKRHLKFSLLAGVLLALTTQASAWWGGGWNPYDPWDPRYWAEEFFGGSGWGGYGGGPWGYGGGPWGYGGPWGGYGYPYYGGYGYGPYGYGVPYYGGYRSYLGGWGYAPYAALPAQTATTQAGKSKTSDK